MYGALVEYEGQERIVVAEPYPGAIILDNGKLVDVCDVEVIKEG